MFSVLCEGAVYIIVLYWTTSYWDSTLFFLLKCHRWWLHQETNSQVNIRIRTKANTAFQSSKIWLSELQYTPWFLLCCVMVRLGTKWFYSYPSGLLLWCWHDHIAVIVIIIWLLRGNHMVAFVPEKQPWRTWVYTLWLMIWNRTTRTPAFWDTLCHSMITNTSNSHQIPSQNKT